MKILLSNAIPVTALIALGTTIVHGQTTVFQWGPNPEHTPNFEDVTADAGNGVLGGPITGSTAYQTGNGPDFFAGYAAEGTSNPAIRIVGNSGTDFLGSDMKRVDAGQNGGTAVFFFEASTTGLTLDSLSITANRNSAATTQEFRWVVQLGSDYYSSEGLAVPDDFSQVVLSDPSTLDWFSYSPETDLTSGSIAGTASTLDFTNLSGAGWYFYAQDGGRSNLRFDVSEFTVTAVPEPSSFALLAGISALGWISLRRRTR